MRSSVHRWLNGLADPLAEAVLEIRDALEKIALRAAKDFIRLYLEKSE